ncbi:MAG TPA: hypothetical protein VIC62_06660 [Nakamurella sp.]
MSTNQEISADQGLPALSASPIGEAKSSGLPAFGRPVPGSARPAESATSSEGRESVERPRALRIGDKVRSHVNDVCVSIGLTGLVVNVAPPRYGAPARARILWDNETVSMADAHTFAVLTERDTTTEDESRVA